MQRETQRIDPYNIKTGTGILGRMTDVLASKGHNIGSFSVDSYNVAVVGEPGISDAPMIVNRNGIPVVKLDKTVDNMLGKIHNNSESESGIFAEMWSSTLLDSIGTNKLLSSELDSIQSTQEYPGHNKLAESLETISKLIATRDVRGVDVDTFYVQVTGMATAIPLNNVSIIFAQCMSNKHHVVIVFLYYFLHRFRHTC